MLGVWACVAPSGEYAARRIVMRWRTGAPATRSNRVRAATGRARRRDRAIRVGIVGGHRVRRRRADPAAGPPPERADRRPPGRGRDRRAGRRARTRHLAGTGLPGGRGRSREADAVFLALPHGAAAAMVPDLRRSGTPSSTSGPTSGCAILPTIRAGMASSIRRRSCSRRRSTACRSCIATSSRRCADADVAIVGAPGCFPTTTLLALAPLARAGLIGDLVVDAKSGRFRRRPRSEAGADLLARSTRASRRTASAATATSPRSSRSSAASRRPPDAQPGRAQRRLPAASGADDARHLRACHVRPTRPVTQAELDELYRDAYADEPFVEVSDTPIATGQVLGSNYCRVHVTLDERTRRGSRHRRDGQPGEGRRGPGACRLQHRLLAARDDRPRAAAAGAVTAQR